MRKLGKSKKSKPLKGSIPERNMNEMSERTKWYFNDWCKYRNGLREIWQIFDHGMEMIKGLESSKRYTERLEELTRERDNAIHNLQAELQNEFSVTIEGMRKSVDERPATPPSADQLAILQALNMRQKVSVEELEMAEQSMNGNDLALSTLQDIAAAKGVHYRIPTTKKDLILRHIDDLADSASRLLKLERPDSRRERLKIAHRNKYEKHVYDHDVFSSFWQDQDPQSEDEALNLFGGIAPDQIADFKEAVNR